MKKTQPPINYEITGLKNTNGTIAMDRGSSQNSATSQFFINLKDNPSLDFPSTNPGYVVFGKVVSGWSVVKAIGETQTTVKIFGNVTYPNWPIQDITIIQAYIKN
jgi:peptidyl-prolyl cis-trans isomerase A (cyclophilin A)